jgi:hypothetical protein
MSLLGSSLTDTIARLLHSKGAHYAVDQFKRQMPSMGGPLETRQRIGNRSNSSTIQPGASIRGIGDLSRQIAGMMGGAQQQPTQTDPLMDLYQSLIDQLQSPVNMPTGVDTKDLMAQVQKAINPIYDQRASAAQHTTDRARGDVQGMYKALADDYKQLAPEQIAQAQANKEEIEQLYGSLRSNIEGDYSRVSNEQADMFKQLGITDALPDVLDQQNDSVTDALTASSENEAQQLQRYQDIGQQDATYYREGSPNAIMTGNEISTDMLAQLSDTLNQIEAERSSGIQSGYLDQLSQAQNQLGQQQQSAQSETARRQGMLWEMLSGQMNQKQQPLNADSFMAGLPPQIQQSVAGAYTALQRSPEAVYGKVEDKRNPVPGTFVETTPQWYLAQADEMLRRGEIDETTYQALQMYLQLQQK